jgi:hypothetical protein
MDLTCFTPLDMRRQVYGMVFLYREGSTETMSDRFRLNLCALKHGMAQRCVLGLMLIRCHGYVRLILSGAVEPELQTLCLAGVIPRVYVRYTALRVITYKTHPHLYAIDLYPGHTPTIHKPIKGKV